MSDEEEDSKSTNFSKQLDEVTIRISQVDEEIQRLEQKRERLEAKRQKLIEMKQKNEFQKIAGQNWESKSKNYILKLQIHSG